MTRDRDIDRVLEHWFADGPSVIPDRVMAQALQRVGRTPQRRLAALLSRYRPMPASIRLGLAAAAVVAVVVAGMTFFRPATGPAATPSPSPTAAPSSSAPIPAALIGQWMGSPRVVSGIGAESGTSMRFTESGFVFTASNRNDVEFLPSSAASLAGDRFALQSTSATWGCGLDEVGTYTWSLSSGGRIMTITAGTDDCEVRGGAVPGTWWKMDCPTTDDPCLGGLEAGTYASQFIDPFVADSGRWTARYAALTYTVPEGWTNTYDWPTQFGLAPPGAADTTAINVFTDIVVKAESADCAGNPDPTVGESAEAISTWLATTDGLDASEPKPVIIGGLSGWRVDIALDPAWTTTCPFSAGQPVKNLFIDRDPRDGLDWPIGPGVHMRVYLLDLGDGRAALVDIEASTQSDYAAFVEDATTIVESFEFRR